jgi:hypothetical protein
MPAGSLVTAARAGVVVDVTLRYQEGGYDIRNLDRANSVTVVHDDGTVAEYAHLSPGPALVAPGQRVAAGEPLGTSGNTGYSGEAHLHFIVTHPVVSDGQVSRVSVPVLFYAGNPAVRFSAQMGTTVRADYGGAYAIERPMKKGLRPVSRGECYCLEPLSTSALPATDTAMPANISGCQGRFSNTLEMISATTGTITPT